VIATIVVAVLAAANREIGLPRFRDKLSRNAQDWLGEKSAQFTPRRDNRSNILITGKAAIAARREIEQPSFRLPGACASFGRQLVAARARCVSETTDHPQGFLLEEVTQPENIAAIESQFDEKRPVILTAREHTWLKPNQCFVASDISFDHLTEDAALRQYSSTPQLISELHNPSLDYGAETRVTVHRRFVQPVLDVTLVCLGLPLVLSRSHRNMFVAAGQCLLLVGLFFVIGLACQSLGNTVVISPALAAWLPLMILGPVAYVMAARRWE
jgi:lipopolysaccharide export system permease protein